MSILFNFRNIKIIPWVLALFVAIGLSSEVIAIPANGSYIQIKVNPSLRVYTSANRKSRHRERSLYNNNIVQVIGRSKSGRSLKIHWCGSSINAKSNCHTGWIANAPKYYRNWEERNTSLADAEEVPEDDASLPAMTPTEADSLCTDCAEDKQGFIGNATNRIGEVLEQSLDKARARFQPNLVDEQFMSPKERASMSLAQKLADYPNQPWVRQFIANARKKTRICIGNSCSVKKRGKIVKVVPSGTRKKTSTSTGYCLRYVKRSLATTSVLASAGSWPTDFKSEHVSAKLSGGPLKKLGFTNIIGMRVGNKKINEFTAPKGAILVYEGGNYGHIEVKTGVSEYTSDYIDDEPRSKSAKRRGVYRKLIGVYVKI